ncbi:GPI mannosyltransferase 1, partial [Salinomyces thailandicus]
MASRTSTLFSRPWTIYTIATLLRLALLIYGHWQDAHSAVKYTDIDYQVFTDASRFLSRNRSPYDRATYRYTPLLAWLLYPTTWNGGLWFEFGKCLFAAGDVVTGYLIFKALREAYGFNEERAMKFASIWLLNPMVANISTRGSSEGLLAVMVVYTLREALRGRMWSCGFMLGLAVHFKIYPFVYAASIFWWLGAAEVGNAGVRRDLEGAASRYEKLLGLFTKQRRALILSSAITFSALTA